MSKVASIRKWCKRENPLTQANYVWVAGSGGPFQTNENLGKSLILRKNHNYAIPLDAVDGFNLDKSIQHNLRELELFESDIRDQLVDSLISETGIELLSDYFKTTAFGPSTSLTVVETRFGVSVLIWAYWDRRTYAGYLTFAVEGMETSRPKGLMCVRILLFKSDLPK